jgi:hypothetical protein
MLKKKDPSKPFWKRLIKSAEKVKKNSFYPLLIFISHFFFSVNGLLSIGIILQLKVNLIIKKKKMKSKILSLFL